MLAGVTAAIVAFAAVGGGIAIMGGGPSVDRDIMQSSPSPRVSTVELRRIAALRAKVQAAILRVRTTNLHVQRDVQRLQLAKGSGDMVVIERIRARLDLDNAAAAEAVALARILESQLAALLNRVSSQASPGSEGFGAVDHPGVPFGVCEPMSIPGSFGNGLDTAWLFARASSAEGCFVTDGYYVGIGTSHAVVYLSEQIVDRDLTRVDYLWPFAAADVNGDGIDEIAIGAGSNGDWGFTLFRLEGANIVRITWCAGCGALVDWYGPRSHLEGAYEGAFCRAHDGSPVFSTWNVELSDDRTRFGGWLIDYSLHGSRFKEAARRTIEIPVDAIDMLPPGGEANLCGSPIHPASDFIPYAR